MIQTRHKTFATTRANRFRVGWNILGHKRAHRNKGVVSNRDAGGDNCANAHEHPRANVAASANESAARNMGIVFNLGFVTDHRPGVDDAVFSNGNFGINDRASEQNASDANGGKLGNGRGWMNDGNGLASETAEEVEFLSARYGVTDGDHKSEALREMEIGQRENRDAKNSIHVTRINQRATRRHSAFDHCIDDDFGVTASPENKGRLFHFRMIRPDLEKPQLQNGPQIVIPCTNS